MKPATRHYLIVDQGIVTAKRALGPDRQADGSWTFPSAPAGGVLVQPSEYFAATVGEEGRHEERLARLLARAVKAEAALVAARDRITTLEATVVTHAQRLQQGQAALQALAARVTALENA